MSDTAEELTMLEPGWDGYKGLPVSLDSCNLANRISEALVCTLNESPQFVPGVDGDIQIEYHGKEYTVEIYVQAKSPTPPPPIKTKQGEV